MNTASFGTIQLPTVALEGLSNEQIDRVRSYVDLLRRVGPRESATMRVHAFLSDLQQKPADFTEKEAMDLALEGQTWARQQR